MKHRGGKNGWYCERPFGLKGQLTLVSPTRETTQVVLPHDYHLKNERGGVLVRGNPQQYVDEGMAIEDASARRAQKRLKRLLSSGWKVVQTTDQPRPSETAEEIPFAEDGFGVDVRSEAEGQPDADDEKASKGESAPPESESTAKDGAEKSIQKEPEDVDEVAEATSKTSEDVHGGDEATKDVEDSKNAADNGQNPDNNGAEAGVGGEEGDGEQGTGGNARSRRGHKGHSGGSEEGQGAQAHQTARGSRGGRSPRQLAKKARERQQAEWRQQHAERTADIRRHGGNSVYSPMPLRVSPETQRSAKRSAELLAQLVGRSTQKTVMGTEVDVFGLLVALETGDNPIPLLDRPRLRPRLRVLLTPDSSGSTQDWSGLGCAWALEISKLPDVDVMYVDNCNGEFTGVSAESVDTLLKETDIVIYLGDGDGRSLCEDYASKGATVIALDSYCAHAEQPRLSEAARCGKGALYWVDRVSVNAPETWYEALKLVLERQL